MQTPHYSVKRTDFAVPVVHTWTVQSSLDNVDAGRTLAQDCLVPLYTFEVVTWSSHGRHMVVTWSSPLSVLQKPRNDLYVIKMAGRGLGDVCRSYIRTTL